MRRTRGAIWGGRCHFLSISCLRAFIWLSHCPTALLVNLQFRGHTQLFHLSPCSINTDEDGSCYSYLFFLSPSLSLSPSLYLSLSLSLYQIGSAHVCTPVTLASR